MNGMEKITARMEADASRALDELNEQTERQLRALRAESEERAENERRTRAGRARSAAGERYERLCSAAEMESRKLMLESRRQVLDEAYALALDKLCAMERGQYIELLLRLLKSTASGGETLVLSRADHDAVGKELAERASRELGLQLTLSETCAPIRAGFVLESRDYNVNCAMETLLFLSRGKTERGAAERLFGA